VYTYKAKVIKIVDGDTMDVAVDLGFNMTMRIRIRVMGIDTPEVFKPESESEAIHGAEASRRAKELLLDKDITIQTFKDASAYNRYSAKITLPDGKDFCEIMLKEGFQKNEKYE
jgi:micrococcal nuclease